MTNKRAKCGGIKKKKNEDDEDGEQTRSGAGDLLAQRDVRMARALRGRSRSGASKDGGRARGEAAGEVVARVSGKGERKGVCVWGCASKRGKGRTATDMQGV
jgi:hypothetical protein